MAETSRNTAIYTAGEALFAPVQCDGIDAVALRTEASEWPSSRPIAMERVCEGLVFATRPLDRVCDAMARHYAIGKRGPLILMLVKRGVREPNELARVLSCSRSLMTSELARIADSHLTTTEKCPDDARRNQLSLTGAGHEAAEAVHQAMIAVLEENLCGYSPEALEQFAAMLRDARVIRAS